VVLVYSTKLTYIRENADLKFGPYTLTDNLTLERNPFSWTQHFDVLFVDNPVGTGYSFVDPPAKVYNLKVLADKDILVLSRKTILNASSSK
jgi:carboxypeptidase D